MPSLQSRTHISFKPGKAYAPAGCACHVDCKMAMNWASRASCLPVAVLSCAASAASAWTVDTSCLGTGAQQHLCTGVLSVCDLTAQQETASPSCNPVADLLGELWKLSSLLRKGLQQAERHCRRHSGPALRHQLHQERQGRCLLLCACQAAHSGNFSSRAASLHAACPALTEMLDAGEIPW